MSAREYYEVLELRPFSDGATVDQAYWHLAKAYQTQAVADPRARLLLDELNEAYGVLGTPRLREDYDAHLAGLATHSIPSRRQKPKGAKKAASFPGFRISGKGWNPFSRPKRRSMATEMSSVASHANDSNETRANTRQEASVTELRASTNQMLERWRTRAEATSASASTAPDMTLVDIFRSENDLGSRENPLAAVMEILKAPRDVMPANVEA